MKGFRKDGAVIHGWGNVGMQCGSSDRRNEKTVVTELRLAGLAAGTVTH